MANTKRRQTRPTGQTYGNVAYKLDYYGDVVAAPKTKIKPQLRAVDAAAVPQSTPTVNHRPHERTRVSSRRSHPSPSSASSWPPSRRCCCWWVTPV